MMRKGVERCGGSLVSRVSEKRRKRMKKNIAASVVYDGQCIVYLTLKGKDTCCLLPFSSNWY